VFIFKLSKTSSHIGSLVVAWYPGLTTPAPSLEDSGYVHRNIIDISKGNEFAFEVPYTAITPYTATSSPTGLLVMYVNTALTGPSTVSSTIDIQVEVKGGPQFELAWFGPTAVTPFIPYFPPALEKPRPSRLFPERKNAGHAQMEDETCKINTQEPLGGSSIGPETIMPAQLCIGEKVETIRSLLQRFTRPQLPAGLVYPIAVRPEIPGVVSEVATQDDWVFPPFWGDYWSLLATMYRFHRGGMRWAFGYESSGAVQMVGSLNLALSAAALTTITSATETQRGEQYQQLNNDFNMLVEGPQYGATPMFLLRPAFSHVDYATANLSAPLTGYSASTQYQAITKTGTDLVPLCHRAIAEDTQLGGFLGVLPFVTATPAIPALAPLGKLLRDTQAQPMSPQRLPNDAVQTFESSAMAPRPRPAEPQAPTSGSMGRTPKNPISGQEYAAQQRPTETSPPTPQGMVQQTYNWKH
jgi:hypothetical protein